MNRVARDSIEETIQRIEDRKVPSRVPSREDSRYPVKYALDYLRAHCHDFGFMGGPSGVSRHDAAMWLRQQFGVTTYELESMVPPDELDAWRRKMQAIRMLADAYIREWGGEA